MLVRLKTSYQKLEFLETRSLVQSQSSINAKRYQTNRDSIPIEIWKQLAVAKEEETWTGLAKRAGIKGYSNIHVEWFIVIDTFLISNSIRKFKVTTVSK